MSVPYSGMNVVAAHPEKVLFPKTGSPKRTSPDTISGSPVMHRHLAGRPVLFKHYPDGIDQPGFIQEQVLDHFLDWIKTAIVPRRSGGAVRYVLVEDAATLTYLADQAVITLHTFLNQ